MIKNRFFPIAVATLLVMLCTIAAWSDNLDLVISGSFYQPGIGFPLKNNGVVTFFYDSISWMVTASILFFLAYPLIYWRVKQSRKYWRTVLALFLALAIGPGVIVNSIFKDNFGRPRPVQTIEFGGQYEHKAALEANWGNPGKSFPSGHASVPLGYLLLVFAAYRRNHKTLAKNLAIGIVCWYLAVSYARIAAGGHHFTDVAWGGYIAFVSAWLSYLYIERRGDTVKD